MKEDLPIIVEDFILNPGTIERPRIMYTKYTPSITKFKDYKPPRIDIERYLSEIDNICNNPNKSSYDAYQIVVDIGLQNYVDRNESKGRICEVLGKYLNVIRDERLI